MAVNWVRELKRLWRGGAVSEIIVHGNVSDLIPYRGQYLSFGEFASAYFEDFDLIIFYDLSSGITFANPEMEAYYLDKFLGLNPELDGEARTKQLSAVRELLGGDLFPRAPEKAIPLLESILKGDAPLGWKLAWKVLLVVEYSEMLTPESLPGTLSPLDRYCIVTFSRWAKQKRLFQGGSLILLLTPSLGDIYHALREAGTALGLVEIPYPSERERYTFIRHLKRSEGYPFDLSMKTLAHITSGLSRVHILRLAQVAASMGRKLTAADVALEKKKILEAELAGLIQVMEPRFGMEAIGGLEYLKDYFGEVVLALEEGDVLSVPMGAIFAGPPGTGKTAIAEAFAQEANFNFIKLLAFRDPFVGQSERNFERILSRIRSLAPVVMVEDDADQSEQRRDEWVGDSGVSTRIRQKRFDFLSDPSIRGKVLWIRITNRPWDLDPADKRAGRASARAAFVMPGEEEKAKIFAVMPAKHNFETDVKSFASIVRVLTRYHGELISGAEIEDISIEAAKHARRRGSSVATREDYLWAITDFMKPPASKKEVERMEREAVALVSSRRLLPPRYRDRK